MFLVSSQPLEELAFLPCHTCRIMIASFMIISQQMDKSVYQQPFKFSVCGMPLFSCLPFCSGERDDNVTQGGMVEAGKGTLAIGKRKNVGCPVLSAIPAVEGTHGLITDKKNAQFPVRKTGALE